MDMTPRLIVAAAICVASVGLAQAQDVLALQARVLGTSWVPIYTPPADEDGFSQLSIHRKRHTKVGRDTYAVWVRWDYTPSRTLSGRGETITYNYILRKDVYDCSGARMRIVEATLYNTAGTATRPMNFTEEQKNTWQEAVPDSNQEIWSDLICGIMREEHRANK